MNKSKAAKCTPDQATSGLRFYDIPIAKETLNKSVRGEYFPFSPFVWLRTGFDTPRPARHSGRTENVSNHILDLFRVSLKRCQLLIEIDHAASHAGSRPLTRIGNRGQPQLHALGRVRQQALHPEREGILVLR